mmetsp:Transcript_28508/g.84392  ORF Transcript_28508/g.84392 Transcript_28508/m.84392 type:complete len:247 (-) Transcript_28508:567-1307(-)
MENMDRMAMMMMMAQGRQLASSMGTRMRGCVAHIHTHQAPPCAKAALLLPTSNVRPMSRIPGIGRVPHSRHWSGTSLAPHSRRRPCPALPAKSGTLACAYFSSHCNRPAPCGRACLLQPPRFAASASCGARAHGGELLVRLAARRGSHLCAYQLGVARVGDLHELVVVAPLSDAAGVDERDDVGVAHCRQAVRDHDAGPADHDNVERSLDLALCCRVERRRRLVQQHDLGLLQHRARNCDTLLLTT